MAFPDDVFPVDDVCEICGGPLGDEIVIQEFADGSYARLCPECAAGATFGRDPETPRTSQADQGQDAGDRLPALPLDDVELDPLEMTKELLVPVTDLITLQGEMQAALERLAGSLERFASEVITDSLGRTATMEGRLRSLESELERTRTRLREAEGLLIATGTAASSQATAAPSAATGASETAAEGPPPVFVPSPATAAPSGPIPTDADGEPTVWDIPSWDTGTRLAAAGDSAVFAAADQAPTTPAAPSAGESPAPPSVGAESAAAGSTLTSDQVAPGTAYLAGAPSGPAAACPGQEGGPFSLEEVQWTQRYFNESPFTARMRDVRRSLGRPKANLSRLAGSDARVLVTVLWDIVWYQYLVNLSRESIAGERVSLFREGMELEELHECFRDKNASIDDDGRLDASELEVRLLSDPTVLIAELPPDEEKALEDATEEIWDQRAAPEFKWDD